MKHSFTKLILLAAVAIFSGNVWGDTTATFSPTAEYNTRPATDGSKWTAMKVANSTNNTFEITASANFYAVQQYKVTDLAAVKSLTITLYHPNKGMDAAAIWAVNGTFDKSMSASDFNTLFENTTGMKPGAAGTTKSDYLLVNTGKNTKIDDSNAYAVFTISGDALTTLKSKAAADGTITLLITNKVADLEGFATSQRKYYSIGYATEAYRPVMTVTYAPVYNVTTGAQYTGLKAAVDAAAANDEIKVIEDQSLSARVDIANAITIDGNNKTLTINQTTASGFLVKAAATIKNATIAGADGGKAVFEFANSTDKTNFAPTIENVTVNNANVGSNGVYRIKDYAQVTLKNVVNSGITVTDGYAEIFLASAAQTTACKLAGTNTVASVYFEAGKRLYVYGATISSPIALTFKDGYTIPTACVIQGSNSLDDFTVTNSNIALYVSKNGEGANNEMGVLSTSYDLSVSSAGAATLVLPFDATIPANVKVYTLNYTSGNTTAKATEVTGTLSKNIPVYVKANEGTYTFSLAENGTKSGTYNPTYGALTGVYTKTDVPTDSYILYNGSEGVGFYLSNSSTVAPYRCYLTADGAGSKAITISFDDETNGISDLTQQPTSNTQVYNLAGQRVNANTKGIVIINGRKYLNK